MTSKNRENESNSLCCSFRKKNSTFVDQDLLASFPTILAESNRLSVCRLSDLDDDGFYIEVIGPMLLASHVTCLDIDLSEIVAEQLIDLIQHLPYLQSLVVKSIAPIQEGDLSLEDTETLRLLSQTRPITKVRLISVTSLSEMEFLIDLCSGMHYLQIDDMHDIDLEVFLRFIIMKSIEYLPNLFFMCFGSPKSNECWLEQLDKMIGVEQLLQDYAIQQIQEKIYLRWTV